MNVSVNELVGLVCTIPNFSRRWSRRNLDRNVVIKEATACVNGTAVRITYVEIVNLSDTAPVLVAGSVCRSIKDGKVLGVYAAAKPTTDTERQLGVLYRQRERVKAAGVINGI